MSVNGAPVSIINAASLPLDAGDGRREPIRIGRVKELKIGDFAIPNAAVIAMDVSSEVLRTKVPAESNAGLFGAEYPAWNLPSSMWPAEHSTCGSRIS